MGKDYEDYFKNSVENPSLNTTENEESKELFTGSMDDIDTWVKFHKLLIEKENQESERALRKENAKKAFWFSAIWAIFIAIFILLHAFISIHYFRITENEFIFVCGTLTASILIFYLTVIKNLFPKRDI
ncbi:MULTISPECIES: hypothetical protein [Mesonia]|uniref:Uncharacterized protein n=1 Tax=Mesonia oceanica TaxID=2687242 RepID=A0AC61YCM7_9FLAO|nr:MULTISPECIES: hypothetical protein [Mesonia]MAN26452.1 hypothetical protein [Mesonia sp.]MAQ41554.1 hypothetical protein [Mesonia sp.]MBJ96360.1 hypothetical protein [Flavobacteriaceae bacterium]VVV02251.1 hypothetical protein FVB9532_03549 [Mesonia oceanica]|tara:strand:+ start:3827 stop:4213 length:387 start_codon:yes stop_codon:yes gene_type:complete